MRTMLREATVLRRGVYVAVDIRVIDSSRIIHEREQGLSRKKIGRNHGNPKDRPILRRSRSTAHDDFMFLVSPGRGFAASLTIG